MDYFNFNGNLYVLICDYFLKFTFLYRAKTSFWCLRDHLIDLSSVEGYPDKIVSNNGPPFSSKEFAKFLSGLGIKHTTSSPGYLCSNGITYRWLKLCFLNVLILVLSGSVSGFENNMYRYRIAITSRDTSWKKTW